MTKPYVVEYKEREYTRPDGSKGSYKTYFFDNQWFGEVESTVGTLARLTATLEQDNLSENFREAVEEKAAEVAEYLEVEFVYINPHSGTRRYTPEVFWEASGGCEWEESAQWGSDYGWDVR